MAEPKLRHGWDTGDWTGLPSITIWPYDPRWPAQYEQSRQAIAAALGDLGVTIEHIGSTSVPGLGARRGIDILIGLRDSALTGGCIERLQGLGYDLHFAHSDWVHLSGLGAKLHLTPFGGSRWVRHVLFRDYLRAHPETAAEYERLKRELAAKHGSNGQRYVDGKTAFVEAVLDRAAIAAEVGV